MNVFDLMAKISLNTKDFEDKLSGVENQLNKVSGPITNALGKIAKATAAAVAGAAVGVSALTKQSVQAYANYEQLVGGVETLFGTGGKSLEEYIKTSGLSVEEAYRQYKKLDSAQKTVMTNAANAYKTAGLSANEYMESVTSFSASLLQGLGGDTERAAEIADKAIIDMADNANKMGTDIQSIQNAYMGFAKQNYTMLDNLKLGYGGTQSEMIRLINDSGILSEKIESLDNITFDQMIEAIHVVQTNMGITGTTAEEASKTISGSIAAMRSAWENLIAGLANPDADLGLLISNFVESGKTALSNLTPAIKQALKGVSTIIKEAAPIIAEVLPELMSDILPDLLSAAVTLVSALIESLPEILQAIGDALPEIMNTIFASIESILPESLIPIFEKLKDAINGVVEWLSNLDEGTLETIETIAEIVAAIAGAIVVLSTIIKTISAVSSAISFLTSPMGLIVVAIAAVITIGVLLVKHWDEIVEAAKKLWDDLKEFGENLIDGVKEVVENIKKKFEDIKQSIREKINTAKEAVASAIEGIKEKVRDGLETALSTVRDKLEAIRERFHSIFENAKTIVRNSIERIKSALDFKWSLPQLKLPHIVVGSYINVPVLGTIPDPRTLRVDWYKKAYDQPYMFDKPTVLQGFGDGAGDEMVYGKDSLMSDIKDASGSVLASAMQSVTEYLEQILDKMEFNVVLDDGTLVGKLAPRTDTALNDVDSMRGRGLSIA